MPRHGRNAAGAFDARWPVQQAVTLLTEDRVTTRQAIAEAAGWTPPYLSLFLNKSADDPRAIRPSAPKVAGLLRTLWLMTTVCPPHVARAVEEKLDEVMRTYEVSRIPYGHPALPLRCDAPNHVSHANVARFVDTYVHPGWYAIDGPPMSGRSTALGEAACRLSGHGYTVIRVDGAQLTTTSQRTGPVVGRVLAALLDTDPASTNDTPIWETERRMRDALVEHPAGVAFVIDNVDALPDPDWLQFRGWLRSIEIMRADGDPAFARVSIWATSDRSRRPPNEAGFHAAHETLRIPWFDEHEVRDLALCLAPIIAVRSVERDWPMNVVAAACSQFRGQPALTHQYLWDSAMRGGSSLVPTGGAYQRHLRRSRGTSRRRGR